MVARLISTLDHLSSGRIGWTVQPLLSDAAVTAVGQALPIPKTVADRIRRAEEFVDVCRKLWDSWDADALVADPKTAIFADPEKVHEISHHGEFYNSRGPLNTVRMPQGRPVTTAVPMNAVERHFAAQYADVVIVSGRTSGELAEAAAAMRSEIAAMGRAGKVKILVSVSPVIAASDSGAKAAEAAIDAAYGANVIRGVRFAGTSQQVCEAVETLVDETGADGFSIEAIWLPTYVVQLMSYLVTPLQRKGSFPVEYGADTFQGLLSHARL